MINRTNQQASTTPLPKSPTTPVKAATAKPEAPTMARDQVKVSASPESNIFHDSPGRLAADVIAGGSAGAEVARDIKNTAAAVQHVGSKLPLLGGLGARVATMLDVVADWGTAVGSKLPALGAGFVKFAKAAPILGVGIAFLDIGRAVVEKNPEKKKVAEGQAVLSAVGGLAGVVGAGAAVGATAFGVALAPLAVPALVVGLAATGLALADTYMFEGKVSKAISSGIGKAWDAITSL